MRISLSLAILAVFLVVSVPAFAFDCFKPDFGAPLSEIDDGHFVPYMTKGEVTYYNYTGPCRLPAHDYANVAVSFAFVDGRFYARIVRGWGNDINVVLDNIQSKLGPYTKSSTQGDWIVYTWNKSDQLKVKLKHNPKTTETKTATYYNPLGKLLEELVSHDPAK